MDYDKLTKEYFQALNNIGVKTEDITLVNIDNLNSDMEFLFDKIKFLTYEMPIVNKGTLSELPCYQDFININNKLINYHSKRLKLESNIKNAN